MQCTSQDRYMNKTVLPMPEPVVGYNGSELSSTPILDHSQKRLKILLSVKLESMVFVILVI